MDQAVDPAISKRFLNACQQGQVKLLQHFIDQNKNSLDWTIYRHSTSGDTGLHLAARNGHIDIVKLLCKCCKSPKSDVNIMNSDSKRPLHDAAQFSKSDIVKILVEQGATVNTFKKADWTPLMLACTKSGVEAKACIELLLEANADPFLKNKDGWTAFFIACRTGDYDIVHYLLNKFGSRCLEDKSNNGRTVLHICVFHGHTHLIDLLIQNYPYLLKAKDSVGYTALHESIKNRNLEMTRKLISLGSDVTEVDFSGRTLLHIAALCGNVEVLKYILNNDLISASIKDSFGNTAYTIAEKNKMQEIVRILNRYLQK